MTKERRKFSKPKKQRQCGEKFELDDGTKITDHRHIKTSYRRVAKQYCLLNVKQGHSPCVPILLLNNSEKEPQFLFKT